MFSTPKELTLRKLYGAYWHSLTVHAPLVSRMVSLSAVNTEEEERLFADINAISRNTSSGKPGHIIPNSILRLQAEQQFKSEREDSFMAQQSKISKYAKLLPESRNTEIYGSLLSSELYQAHLERVSDYLVVGEGVWWHRDVDSHAIVFHDSDNEPDWREEGPPIQHFRSTTFSEVNGMVRDVWNKCLTSDTVLPLERLKVFDQAGEFASIKHFSLFGENEHDQTPQLTTEDDTVPEIPQYNSEPDDCTETASELCTRLELVNESEYTISDIEGAEDGVDKDLVSDGQAQEKSAPSPTSQIRNNTVEVPTTNFNKPCLQTTLAKNCSKVVGECAEVLLLDKWRCKLRQNNNKTTKDNYLTSLAKVQTKVLSEHGKLKKSIYDWEIRQVTEQNKEPWAEDLKKNYEMHDNYKKLKLAQQLLKHWKISVHL